MRVTLPVWAVYCLLGGAAALGDELSLPGVSATPGTRIILSVEFRSLGGSVAGVQFDLQYDSAAMSIAATADDAVLNSGKSLYYADLAPNKRRFLVVGLNQNPIPSGTLINLLVYLTPNASNGLYPLVFSNIVATDRYGLAEPTTGVDGAVMVQAAAGQGAGLQSTGVVNGASLLPGPVAPGEIVRLVASFVSPTSPVLAETRVLFDGTPAPLFSAAPGAIEAIVPYAVSGKSLTRMQVTNGERVIAELLLPAAAAVPGIFTLNSSGIGPGAALDQDSSMNSSSNPAARGTVVAMFATGTGQTGPPGSDGLAARDLLPQPTVPISVRIGGVDAEVLYAGAAPTFAAGVDLVICRIPANAASGLAVPVVIKVGTASSQPGVTLAVQ